MAANFPYFKFTATEWLTGDIIYEDYELQGIFINVCAIYWNRDGKITIDEMKKRIKSERLAELSGGFFSVSDGLISIAFLDEQLITAKHVSKINSKNGKKGGRPKALIPLEEKAVGLIPFNETITKKSNKEEEEEKEEEVENVHTLSPSVKPSISQSEIDRFNHYSSWAAENAPKLLKIKKPLTATQLSDIRSKYSAEQFKEVCLAMEAKKDFLSKYDNLNLTMRSWLKRQFGDGGSSEPPPKIPLQKGIQMPKLVTPVVNFEDAI
jgi:hypothetical protein